MPCFCIDGWSWMLSFLKQKANRVAYRFDLSLGRMRSR